MRIITETEKTLRHDIYDHLKSAIMYARFYRTDKEILALNLEGTDRDFIIEQMVDDRDAAAENLGIAQGLGIAVLYLNIDEKGSYDINIIKHIAGRVALTRKVTMKIFNS